MPNKKQLIPFIIILSVAVFCARCDFIWGETQVEIEHLLSPNKKREAIIELSKSGYTRLLTKTKEKDYRTDYSICENHDSDGNRLYDFVTLYKTRRWINDKMLIFAVDEAYKNSNDRVVLKNMSSKVIEQIEVDPGDMYFVYDIQPNEKVEIPVSWSKKDFLPYSTRCNIIIRGNFVDNTSIPLKFRFDQLIENEKAECGNVEVKISEKDVSFEQTK
jgi:hypothetical protein